MPLPADVRVEDYGIRGLHLALDLLDGCDLLVLVDALAARRPAGHRVRRSSPTRRAPAPTPLDAHRMDPQAVLQHGRRSRAATIGRVLVVGCQPADLGEGIGLSAAVAAAVAPAVRVIEDLIAERNAPCSVA